MFLRLYVGLFQESVQFKKKKILHNFELPPCNKLLGDCFSWESGYFCFLHVFDVHSNNLILKGQNFQGCVISARTHSDFEMIVTLRVD